jgi:hypothetical protein
LLILAGVASKLPFIMCAIESDEWLDCKNDSAQNAENYLKAEDLFDRNL